MTLSSLAPSAPAALESSTSAASAGGVAWIDVAALVLVLLCLVLGARRGLWWQSVRLLGLVAAFCVARALAPRLAPGLTNVFGGLSLPAANGVLWVALLLLGVVVVGLVGRIGKAALEGAELSTLDRAGGAVFGAASGVVLFVGAVLCATQFASPAWTEKNVRGSSSQVLIDGLARRVPGVLDPLTAERATSTVFAAEPAPR